MTSPPPSTFAGKLAENLRAMQSKLSEGQRALTALSMCAEMLQPEQLASIVRLLTPEQLEVLYPVARALSSFLSPEKKRALSDLLSRAMKKDRG